MEMLRFNFHHVKGGEIHKEFTSFKPIFMHRFGTFLMPFQGWQGLARALFQCQSEQWKVNQKILLELLDGH